MLFLSDNNRADDIEAFNSTSRYLNDLLNILNSKPCQRGCKLWNTLYIPEPQFFILNFSYISILLANSKLITHNSWQSCNCAIVISMAQVHVLVQCFNGIDPWYRPTIGSISYPVEN